MVLSLQGVVSLRIITDCGMSSPEGRISEEEVLANRMTTPTASYYCES